MDKAKEFYPGGRRPASTSTYPIASTKTIEYFEQSLKATHTLENMFAYAYFLHTHNQFNAALP